MSKILRKVRILKEISSAIYEGVDVLDGSVVTVMIKGKMRMNYIKLLPNDIVYIVANSEEPTIGQLIYEKYICLHNPNADLCLQKKAINEKEQRLNSH